MSEIVQPRFPTTCWQTILQAMKSGEDGADALGRLLGRYMTPLRAHLVSHMRLPGEKADDMLQTFIADKVLERDLISGAAPEKGKFRTFLLVSLDRFALNQIRNENRQRRSPGTEFGALTDATDPRPGPSNQFEMAWARQVLALAADRMRQECSDSGRGDIWGVFEGRVLTPALQGGEPAPYEELVASFSLASNDAASNLLVTGKRIFARNLRFTVMEYLSDETQVEEEIADLRKILARGGD